VTSLSIIPISGVPEISEGDDLAQAIVDTGIAFEERDVLVVTQKVISKAEGRVAPAAEKDERVLAESRSILRRVRGMVISQTRHGFVCANAGVDSSNIEGDRVVLLPVDPDLSARRIRSAIAHLAGTDVGVVITDTFGRPWRVGQTDVAIGVAGIPAFADYVGTTDTQGRALFATRICIADEIAGAAELVMGKATGVCAAIVRGYEWEPSRSSAVEIVRPPAEDLFR
jgi:coenzyme F420-0:L-glutamate ligase/coenzyme F420-1:gamma-L-glutamate ligase